MDAFRVGNVFSRAFGLTSRQFVLFFLVAAAGQVPGLIITLQMPSGQLHQPGAVFGTVALVSILIGVVLLPLTQAIIYHAAFQEMLGRPIRLGASFALALRRFFPVFGTLICMGVVIGFGFILLLVPGIIWATMFAVAVPVCVVERLGPFHSLGRSRFLTKGHRWKILGIALVLLLIAVAVDIATGVGTFTVGLTFGHLIDFLVQSALGAFWSVLAVVIYHDLRVSREGVTTDRIAAVFD